MVGLIVPVPKTISETGYIKIVADQRHCRTEITRWKLLACSYDMEKKVIFGDTFQVSEKEVNKWIQGAPDDPNSR